jgi:hypothetical protein
MEKYLSPEQVCDLVPGMTKGTLAGLRYTGGGPQYRKPSRKTILYRESDVLAWIEASAHERTDKPLAASA